MYTVYSKDNCPFCVKAVSLLENKEEEHSVIKVGEGITLDELIEKFDAVGLPRPRSVPQIFKGDRYIGGYTELEKELI